MSPVKPLKKKRRVVEAEEEEDVPMKIEFDAIAFRNSKPIKIHNSPVTKPLKKKRGVVEAEEEEDVPMKIEFDAIAFRNSKPIKIHNSPVTKPLKKKNRVVDAGKEEEVPMISEFDAIAFRNSKAIYSPVTRTRKLHAQASTSVDIHELAQCHVTITLLKAKQLEELEKKGYVIISSHHLQSRSTRASAVRKSAMDVVVSSCSTESCPSLSSAINDKPQRTRKRHLQATSNPSTLTNVTQCHVAIKVLQPELLRELRKNGFTIINSPHQESLSTSAGLELQIRQPVMVVVPSTSSCVATNPPLPSTSNDTSHHPPLVFKNPVSSSDQRNQESIAELQNTERAMLEVFSKIKQAVKADCKPDTPAILAYLLQLNSMNLQFNMVNNNPEFVKGIKLMHNYVGNSKEWNLSEEEEAVFQADVLEIREQSKKVFNKIKSALNWQPRHKGTL